MTEYYKLYGKIRKDNNNKVARDVREKKKTEKYSQTDKFDKNLFERGIDWFNCGFPLSDAPEDIRNNTSFISGFQKGERLSLIASLQKNDAKHR